MIQKKSICRQFLVSTVSIITATMIFLAVILIFVKVYECKKECKYITESYINEQESIVKYEVEREVKNIRYRISNSCITNESEKIKYIEQLRAIRFFNKGKEPGIFFIKSYDGVQILSVSKPELEGKDVSQFTDPDGIITHDLFMSTVNKSGGFADYSWFNPVTRKVHIKRSFIKGVPELQWYIGAGFWFEDINSVIDVKNNDLKKDVLRYLIIIALIISILYILIYIISRNIFFNIKDNFNRFSLFFANAASQHILINKEDFNYSEFNKLSDSANKMLLQRKNAEELLKESEANLKSLINNRKESIWSIDKNYNYISFNTFFSEAYIAAYKIELKKGFNAIEILTPELQVFWKPKYEKALLGQKVDFEFSAQIKDELFYYKVFLNPIISDNIITGVSALSIDITMRKKAEQELKKYRENLEQMVQERTTELEKINNELLGKNNKLEKFNDVFVSREFRIKELKDEIEQLKQVKR